MRSKAPVFAALLLAAVSGCIAGDSSAVRGDVEDTNADESVAVDPQVTAARSSPEVGMSNAPLETSSIAPSAGPIAFSCTNYTHRYGPQVGCCNSATRRLVIEICIYGSWYWTNESACVQDTSYCVCTPPTSSGSC